MAKKPRAAREAERAAPAPAAQPVLAERTTAGASQDRSNLVIQGSCPVCGANHPPRRWRRHYIEAFGLKTDLGLVQDAAQGFAPVDTLFPDNLSEWDLGPDNSALQMFQDIKDRLLIALRTWMHFGWITGDDLTIPPGEQLLPQRPETGALEVFRRQQLLDGWGLTQAENQLIARMQDSTLEQMLAALRQHRTEERERRRQGLINRAIAPVQEELTQLLAEEAAEHHEGEAEAHPGRDLSAEKRVKRKKAPEKTEKAEKPKKKEKPEPFVPSETMSLAEGRKLAAYLNSLDPRAFDDEEGAAEADRLADILEGWREQMQERARETESEAAQEKLEERADNLMEAEGALRNGQISTAVAELELLFPPAPPKKAEKKAPKKKAPGEKKEKPKPVGVSLTKKLAPTTPREPPDQVRAWRALVLSLGRDIAQADLRRVNVLIPQWSTRIETLRLAGRELFNAADDSTEEGKARKREVARRTNDLTAARKALSEVASEWEKRFVQGRKSALETALMNLAQCCQKEE